MGTLKNIFDFERYKLGNMWGKVKDNPEQLLLGAGDPFSAKMWGGITGKDYEPLVDQWGGATKDDYAKAEAEGIDTRDGRAMHGIARAIAGMYAGKWAGGRFGGEGLSTPGSTPGKMPGKMPNFGNFGGGNFGGGQQRQQLDPPPVHWQDPYNPMNDPASQSLQVQQQRRAVADALPARAQEAGYTKIGAF